MIFFRFILAIVGAVLLVAGLATLGLAAYATGALLNGYADLFEFPYDVFIKARFASLWLWGFGLVVWGVFFLRKSSRPALRD